MTFFEMSAMGAVLICLIVLLRKTAGQRLMPGCYLALWALAGCRLLVPAEISSPFSVYNLFAADSGAAEPLHLTVRQTVNTAVAWIDTGAAGGNSMDWPWLIWLAGAGICFLYMVGSHWQCRRWYAASLPVKTEFVRRWQAAHPLRRTYQIRQSQLVQTPLTYGFFRPVILLPAHKPLTDEELHLVLLHEWNHIRHLDVLWQWLLVIICCVHWFNPAVWVMYVFCRQDLELLCDGAVARQLAPGQNRSYAMLLLEQAASVRKPAPVFSSFRFTGYRRMEERIQMIMKPERFSWKIAVITLLLLCAGGAAFATSAADDGNSADIWIDTGSVTALVWPVASEDAEVTMNYGVREHPVTGMEMRMDHITIGGQKAEGAAILAAADGTVKEAGFDARQGNYLVITHGDNLETSYGHCEKLLVGTGGTVTAGEPVAILGKTGDATGPCLSFAVYQNGEACDPMPWFGIQNENETETETAEKQTAQETEQ